MDSLFYFNLKENKLGYIIILIYILLILFLLIFQSSSATVFLFPLFSIVVGFILYFRFPCLYIGYTLWLWFLSSLIRRIIDYKLNTYTMGGLYTTPTIVTFISVIALIKEAPRFYKDGGLPFLSCFGVVLYGLLIGIIQNSFTDLSIIDSTMGLLTPIMFGFYVYSNWRLYTELYSTLYKVFIWSTFLMGAYGLYQFVVAPPWDQFYLIYTGASARGTPEPFGIRVWSTMSAAHQFVFPMMAGILFSLIPPLTPLKFITIFLGVTTLSLTLVRSAWICLLASILIGVFLYKPIQQIKTFLGIIFLGIFIVLIISSIDEIKYLVFDRLSTFSNLNDDFALNVRAETNAHLIESAMGDFVGRGLGFWLESISEISTGDGTFLPMLYWFGLIGTSVYFINYFLLVFKIWNIQVERNIRDFELIIPLKILPLSLLPMTMTCQYFPEAPGMTIWTILGIGMASCKYYSISKK